MDNNAFEQKSHKFLIGILLACAYFMLMFGNGMVSLTHPDEVFYIQSAKEMAEHNKWFTPMIFDDVQFEKPFVAFALFTAAIKYFGMTPAAARFWPALFGVIGVLITYWISFRMFKRKRLSFFSGLFLMTSFIYMALSRAVLTDMIFSVIVAISCGYFYLAMTSQDEEQGAMIWGFVYAAIAVLTKGLLGICFPIGTIIIYSILAKDFSFIKKKGMWLGSFLFLLISVPWHVAMYMDHGQWFVDEYFGNVHVRRLFEAEHARLDNWYFYLGLMFAGVLPWSFFWGPTVKTVIKRFREKSGELNQIKYLIAWIISVYAFMQPATSKLASYIFPLFPAIVILLAYAVDAALTRSENNEKVNSLKICGIIMSVVMFIGIFVGLFFANKYIDVIVSMTPAYVAGGCVFLICCALFIFSITKQYMKLIYSFTGISITLLIMLLFARPYVEPWVSCKDISDVFKTIDNSESTVIASKFYVRGIRYYTDRKMAVIDINGKGFWSPHPIPFMNNDKMVIDLLNSQKITYAVVKEGNVEDLKRIVKNKKQFSLKELDGFGGKYILKITKL